MLVMSITVHCPIGRDTGFAVLLAIDFNILPGVGVAVGAQTTAPITLSEAIGRALQKNPNHKMASADVASACISARSARTSLLPALSFSGAATCSNDPVYVFEAKLRQQIFTAKCRRVVSTLTGVLRSAKTQLLNWTPA